MASPNMKQMLPSSMSQVVLLLTIMILSCSCPNAHARESMFFSKAIHRIRLTTKSAQEMKPILTEIPVPAPEYAPVESPIPAPSLVPETAPVAAPVSSDDGWYGHGTGVHSPDKETETTTTTYPSDKSLPHDNEKYENELMSDEAGDEEKTEYSNKDEGDKYYNNYDSYSSMSNKNTEYSESYKAASSTATSDNSYYYPGNYKTNERQGMSDTRFMENGKYYYNIDKMENAKNQRQGMSDTRFMENGKHYYDVNKIEDDQKTDNQGQGDEKESYATEIETEKEESYENESTPNEENKSKYVFDTMEEYYKSQGYHLNNPEAYIP